MAEDLRTHLDLLPEFDFLNKIEMALQGVQRMASGGPPGLVQAQLVHQGVGRQAEQQQVIGIAQMTVVVHPVWQHRTAVGRQVASQERWLGHLRIFSKWIGPAPQ